MAPHATEITAVSDTEAIVFPDPVLATTDTVAARRAKAGKLVAGTAAATTSDYFKSPQDGKPKSKRWDHILSLEARSRQPSSLKAAAGYLKTPGLISLGGGLPVASNFPIEELSMRFPTPPNFSEASALESGTIMTAGKYDVAEKDGVYDLSIALNYALGTGSAQMVRFVTEHTEIVCNPPYADWQCSLTVGSTQATETAFRMFCERGDFILAEEYTFASAVECGLPLGIKCIGITMDSQGLIPSVMDSILSSWDEKARGARKPHVLYTVPSGQNPTGATQSAARRAEVYAVCHKHDIYILEDEPYYFLQMQPYTGPDSPPVPAPASNDAFLRSLVPTFLSMDTDGRVMRMDSFSKTIAPGSRVGWVTASEQIIERFVRANESSVQNPSGIAQMVLYKLLDEHWGHEGYLKWLINLRLEYTSRRNVLLAACEKFLPKEIVSWNPPAAGMFLWLKIDHTKYSTPGKTLLEIEHEVFLAAVAAGVLVSKGSWFIAERDTFVPRDLFLRATFAAATPEAMTEAMRRFAGAVTGVFGIEG